MGYNEYISWTNNLIFLSLLLSFFNFVVQNDIQIYKSILVQKHNLIFTFIDTGIISYNSESLSKKNAFNYDNDDQKLFDSSEAEMISLLTTSSQIKNLEDQIYITVKNYLYHFSKDGSKQKFIKIENMNVFSSNLIFDKCYIEADANTNSICRFFIAFINGSKKLSIIIIENNFTKQTINVINTITYDIKNSLGENSLSKCDFVSCQVMTKSSDEKILTCFYENQNNEIGTAYFDISDLNEITTITPQFKRNSGAKNIKTVLYANKTKTFVCYINDNNDCPCLFFDIIENKWNDYEYKYLEQCNMPTRFFTFDYFEITNEYILTCFSSIKNMDSLLFDSNMNLKYKNENSNTYCISSNIISFCPSNNSFSIINYNNVDNEYKINVNCNENTDSLSKQQLNFGCDKEKNLIVLNTDFLKTTIITVPTTLITTLISTNINTLSSHISTNIKTSNLVTTTMTTVITTSKKSTNLITSLLESTTPENLNTIPTTIKSSSSELTSTIPSTYSSYKSTNIVNSHKIPSTIFHSSDESTNIIKSNTIPSTVFDQTTNIFNSKKTSLSNIISSTNFYTNIINSNDDSLIIRRTTNKTKEEIANNLDEIIKEVEIGKVYEIDANDYQVKVSPINFNEYESSSTYINFLDCENKLRKKNNLPSDSILTVVLIEIYKYDEKALTNQVEYAVYNDKRQRLDLSPCDNEKIEINYAFTNNSILQYEKILNYLDNGIDVFNIKDDFFNDICYPYSENNSDIILKDRISDIYQNYSFCENNCEYNKINLTTKTFSCSCTIKKEVETEESELNFEVIYLDLFQESTIGVIKCYNLVFTLTDKMKNIGFIIFVLLIISHIPFIIYYIKNDIFQIHKYIINEMKTYHYLPVLKSPLKKKLIKDVNKSKMNIKNFKNCNRQNTINKNANKNANKNNNKNANKNSNKNANKNANKNVNKNNNKNANKNSIKNVIKNANKIANKNVNKKNRKKYSMEESITTSKKKFLDDDHQKSIFGKYKSKAKSVFKPIIIFNYSNNAKKKIYRVNSKNNSKKNSVLLPIIKTKNNLLNKINIIENNKIKRKKSDYYLIKIDAHNTANYSSYQSDYFLDNFTYEEALIYDKRSLWKLYLICLYSKENFLSTFFLVTPLELKPIKLISFMFSYSSDLALNTLFYFSGNISDKYNYKGDNAFWFNLMNNLTISIISFIIGFVIIALLQTFIDSKDNIEDVFREEEKKLKSNKNMQVNNKTKVKMLEKIYKINKKLKYKLYIYIVIEFLIMLFFFYFVTAFCEVYKDTQISWLSDSLTSFLISFPVEFFLALVISCSYKIAIKKRIKCLYTITMLFYGLG